MPTLSSWQDARYADKASVEALAFKGSLHTLALLYQALLLACLREMNTARLYEVLDQAARTIFVVANRQRQRRQRV